MNKQSTFLTIQIHTRLGRKSREKLADILQDTLEPFLDEAVTVHERGPIALTGHRTDDGTAYPLNLHPAQVIGTQPTTYFLWADGKADQRECHPGTRVLMMGFDGTYVVTVRETPSTVEALIKDKA